jgi:diguanylate cyclase (GGDEF)-like protein
MSLAALETSFGDTPNEISASKHPIPSVGRMPTGRLGVYAGLLMSLRAKHAPTAAHCMRVAQNLSAWGLYYHIPEDQLGLIELAGLVHDLGKIGIPERILQKPSKLLPEEHSLVDCHPQIAIEILRSTGVDSTILNALAELGAWYDGSKRSASPDDLSLVQRILSIADAFDAMTSDQTYRPSMSSELAIAELQKNKGSQFDPKLVDSFVEVVRNANNELRRAVQNRWLDITGANSLVYLFKNQNSTEIVGNAAIQSLNGIFHQRMMDHMNDGVIFVDTELRILGWNEAAEKLTGIPRSAVLHSLWSPDLIGMHDNRGKVVAPENCPILFAMSNGQSSTQRFRLTKSNGRPLKIEAQLMPVFDDRNVLRGGALLMGDASDQADLEEMVLELHTQATQDPLTRVSNRADLNRRLPEFVLDSRRKNLQRSVLICDIDFFKRINDTFGHAAGDEALKVFASVLKSEARETDLVARYGGEEFVILCDGCDLVSAVQLAESIRFRLQRTPIDALKGKCLTASFGACEVEPGDAPDAPIDRADRALLQAKQNGRDRVETFVREATNYNAGEVVPVDVQEATSGSWLSWLGGGKATPIVTSDLITAVPRDLTIEKLKGFIAESKADIVSTDDDQVRLRVDCRNAPMQRRNSDRSAVFEVAIAFQDVEVAGGRSVNDFQIQTRVKLEISLPRQRDRRSEAVIDQANRLRFSIQSFLQAELVAEDLLERIIPVYKPGNDGR